MAERVTSGFGHDTRAREVVAGADLSGKTVVVTGAASGIGVETARALAEAGATVVLAVRDLAAGERTVADIKAGAPAAKVSVQHLDLGDLASARGFAAAFGDGPLHILINNAGVMACPLAYTADGLEMQVGTCHFGHFALAQGLIPALQRGADAAGRPSRVVSLSSIGHRRGGIHFDDIHYRVRPYDKWESYGQAKTANSLFALALNARFGSAGINANAVMPGGILTPLQRHLPVEEMRAFGWIDENGKPNARFKTTEQGAATSVWAAVGAELEGIGGLYLEDCAQALPFDTASPFTGVMPHALDPETADRLWGVSEETIGKM